MKMEKTLSRLAGIIVFNNASTRITRLLGSLLLVTFLAAASVAQQRTFVSGLGNDSNPCTRTAPCRTFTQALSLTNAGGEVVVLDSAGYGPFTITQAVTVQAPPGVYAGISVFSGNGVSINTGGTDTVILRGLTVNNQGSNGNGIQVVAVAVGVLRIEGCIVNGFSAANGIDFQNSGRLEVKDSILTGNGNGIFVSGAAQAAIDHVRMNDNFVDGLDVNGGSKVTVLDSIASGNVSGSGFSINCTGSASAELNIEGCVVSSNFYGIISSSGSTGVATVRVSNSTITNNFQGIHNAGSPAVILSRGNNTVEGNTTNTSGTIGPYTAK